MNQTEKILIAVAVVLALAVPTGIHVMGVKAAEGNLVRLRQQIDQAMRDRDSSDRLLSLRQQEWQKVTSEIEALRLFDLRKEERYETVMINRSNLGLIALSEIFEKNGIAIDALEPQPSEYKQVMIAEAPQAGVARRRYVLLARGPYQSLLKVYDALKTLPPTLEVSGYEVAYLDSSAQRATVSLKLDLAFNYLMTPEQLAQAQAAEQTPGAVPTPPISWHPGEAFKVVVDWLMPPAWAQTPPPAKSEKLYTIPVRKAPQMGRSEPFLPLAPVGTASAVIKAAPKTALQVALIGVLLGGDGLPGAIVSSGGQRIRVRPGSVLPNGGEVLAIGDGFVLIRHSGTIHRIGLSRDTQASEPAAPTPGEPNQLPPPIPGNPISGSPLDSLLPRGE